MSGVEGVVGWWDGCVGSGGVWAGEGCVRADQFMSMDIYGGGMVVGVGWFGGGDEVGGVESAESRGLEGRK